MVSTSYPEDIEDWKGRFIERMCAALVDNQSLNLTLWAPRGTMPNGVTTARTPRDSQMLDAMMKGGGIAHMLRTRPARGLWQALHLILRLRRLYTRSQSDLYHINWLQNALPLPRDGRPILLTVLGTDFDLLRLPFITAAVRHSLSGHPTIMAPNANWMCDDLRHRFGDLAEIQAVPFGVDESWFRVERQLCSQKRIWLVVLRITSAKMGKLFEWGRCLSNSIDELHLFGPNQEQLEIPEWIHYHGATNLDTLRSDWYPVASGIITLSEHSEGLPQVLIEAMSSSLPVIASDQPAHRDLIQERKTGFITSTQESFDSAVKALSAIDFNLKMGRLARQHVYTEFGTWKTTAERYMNCYERLFQTERTL